MFWSRGGDSGSSSGGGAIRRRRSEDTFEQPPLPPSSSRTAAAIGMMAEGGGGSGPHQRRHGAPSAAASSSAAATAQHQHQHQPLHANTGMSGSSPRQRFGNSNSSSGIGSNSNSGGGGGRGTTGGSSTLPTTAAHSGSRSKLNGHDPNSPKYHHGHSSNSSNLAGMGRRLHQRAQIQWTKLSRLQRLVGSGLAALLLTAAVTKEAAVIRRVIRRRRHRASLLEQDERRRQMLGYGGRGCGFGRGGSSSRNALRERGIVPWKLARTGRDPSRDALVDWWKDHPEAPVGLSCAAFDEFMMMGSRSNEDADDDDVAAMLGQYDGADESLAATTATATTEEIDFLRKQRGSKTTATQRRKLHRQQADRRTAATSSDHARTGGASSNSRTLTKATPTKKLLNTVGADTYFYKGYGIAPPIFQGRVPETGSQRVQVAFVMPFVEFQLVKVATLLTEYWARFPPCQPDTPRQRADLVFFTENKLSPGIQRRIRSYYAGLGVERTGCFRTDEPIFLSMAEVNPELSHLEGAAFTFYSLFRLLEKSYKTFILAEPDVAPVQPNFLPALVQKTLTVNCEADGFWQVGSLPLAKDVDAGMLRERVDYHMNGNAIYVLGCAEFEEYKCRVQSFYVPKDDCELVAGE